MSHDPRVDPRVATSSEVQVASKLRNDVVALRAYWNQLFMDQYLNVLEAPAEIGRHGVIAELIQRICRDGNVLDAGCGTGILSQLLDLKKFAYLGCDISDVAIEHANTHRAKPNARFRVGRIEDLQDISGLSALVFNEVLYYVDADSVIKSAKSWLRSEGIVVASVFDFPEGNEIRKWLRVKLVDFKEIAIQNTDNSLKWYVTMGRLA